MNPLDCVLVLKAPAPYQGTAGVVEKVERDDSGKPVSVIVDMDIDHKRVRFALSDLRVIKAN